MGDVAWLADDTKMAWPRGSARPDDINPTALDAIYFTGGHAAMWDFPNGAGLQRITRDIFERGGIVSTVCHGYCGLLNTTLSDGSLLVAGATSPVSRGARKCWPASPRKYPITPRRK